MLLLTYILNMLAYRKYHSSADTVIQLGICVNVNVSDATSAYTYRS